jgi:hypothetical protein
MWRSQAGTGAAQSGPPPAPDPRRSIPDAVEDLIKRPKLRDEAAPAPESGGDPETAKDSELAFVEKGDEAEDDAHALAPATEEQRDEGPRQDKTADDADGTLGCSFFSGVFLFPATPHAFAYNGSPVPQTPVNIDFLQCSYWCRG